MLMKPMQISDSGAANDVSDFIKEAARLVEGEVWRRLYPGETRDDLHLLTFCLNYVRMQSFRLVVLLYIGRLRKEDKARLRTSMRSYPTHTRSCLSSFRKRVQVPQHVYKSSRVRSCHKFNLVFYRYSIPISPPQTPPSPPPSPKTGGTRYRGGRPSPLD